jgi:hypothetical protein
MNSIGWRCREKVAFGLLLLVVLVCAGSASGFDGDRKGFAALLGLGYAPYGDWALPDYAVDRSADGMSVQLGIGWGFGAKDQFFLEAAGAGSDRNSYRAIRGITWYHFLSGEERSAFTALGLGLIHFDNCYRRIEYGPGVRLGGGYEILKQFLVGAYSTVGWTIAYDGDREFCTTLELNLTLLGY